MIFILFFFQGLHRSPLVGASLAPAAVCPSSGGGPVGGADGDLGQLLNHRQGTQDALLSHESRQWKMGENDVTHCKRF
jgi:hypothetical protein